MVRSDDDAEEGPTVKRSVFPWQAAIANAVSMAKAESRINEIILTGV
ncbi:MAG: hypothetical protein F6K09_37365 [Merismopedia sp. SIO2A8]|nr:hypothetical protein [Merismopedia sp. SIO2A8]